MQTYKTWISRANKPNMVCGLKFKTRNDDYLLKIHRLCRGVVPVSFLGFRFPGRLTNPVVVMHLHTLHKKVNFPWLEKILIWPNLHNFCTPLQYTGVYSCDLVTFPLDEAAWPRCSCPDNTPLISGKCFKMLEFHHISRPLKRIAKFAHFHMALTCSSTTNFPRWPMLSKGSLVNVYKRWLIWPFLIVLSMV